MSVACCTMDGAAFPRQCAQCCVLGRDAIDRDAAARAPYTWVLVPMRLGVARRSVISRPRSLCPRGSPRNLAGVAGEGRAAWRDARTGHAPVSGSILEARWCPLRCTHTHTHTAVYEGGLGARDHARGARVANGGGHAPREGSHDAIFAIAGEGRGGCSVSWAYRRLGTTQDRYASFMPRSSDAGVLAIAVVAAFAARASPRDEPPHPLRTWHGVQLESRLQMTHPRSLPPRPRRRRRWRLWACRR